MLITHWYSEYTGLNILILLLFSHGVVSESLRFHRLQPVRLLCPWDFPARILKGAAVSFSRGSSWPKDWTLVSCIGRWVLYHWATREAQTYLTCEIFFFKNVAIRTFKIICALYIIFSLDSTVQTVVRSLGCISLITW